MQPGGDVALCEGVHRAQARPASEPPSCDARWRIGVIEIGYSDKASSKIGDHDRPHLLARCVALPCLWFRDSGSSQGSQVSNEGEMIDGYSRW